MIHTGKFWKSRFQLIKKKTGNQNEEISVIGYANAIYTISSRHKQIQKMLNKHNIKVYKCNVINNVRLTDAVKRITYNLYLE